MFSVVSDASPASSETPTKLTVPKVANMQHRGQRPCPMSPTRFTTNAFFAATAAEGLWCQNPMSRYDARPTPSQPRKTPR